jgi:hypothetical protein
VELENLRQFGSPLHQESSSVSASAEEAQGLRKQIAELRSIHNGRVLELSSSDDRIEKSRKMLQELKCNQEAHVHQYGILRQESAAMKEQVGVALECLHNADKAKNELYSKHEEVQRAKKAEIDRLAVGARDLSLDVECSKAALKVAEVATITAQTNSIETKGALAALRSTNDGHLANMESERQQHQRNAATLSREIAELEASRNAITAKIALRQEGLAELKSVASEHQQQLEEKSEALKEEHCRIADADERSKGAVAEVCDRGDRLAWQVENEQDRAAQLSQEVSAACAAASWKGKSLKSRSSSLGNMHGTRPQHKTKTSLRHRSASPFDNASTLKETEGLRDTRVRLQRELKALQGWKREAAGSVQQMSDGLQTMRMNYARQVQYGRELDGAIAQLGYRAQNAASSGAERSRAAGVGSTAPARSDPQPELGEAKVPCGKGKGSAMSPSIFSADTLMDSQPTWGASASASTCLPQSAWFPVNFPQHIITESASDSAESDMESPYTRWYRPSFGVTAGGVYYEDAIAAPLRHPSSRPRQGSQQKLASQKRPQGAGYPRRANSSPLVPVVSSSMRNAGRAGATQQRSKVSAKLLR